MWEGFEEIKGDNMSFGDVLNDPVLNKINRVEWKLRKKTVEQEIIDELFLVCPFCAEKPNVFQVPDDRYGTDWGWVVECKNMGCIFKRSTPHQSFKMLMLDWNTRGGR
jgi:hypothetical protein